MFKKTFFRLVFPSFCMSCHKKIEKSFLCEPCTYNLVLSEQSGCEFSATTFENHFTSRILLNHLKKYKYPELIKTAAAYMALQFASLEWPVPSKVISCRKSFLLKKNFKKFLGKRQVKEKTFLFICLEKDSLSHKYTERFQQKQRELRILSLL